MDVSRRKLFGIGAAFAAAAAVPEIAEAKPAEEAIGPMMFEHTCDGGASRNTPEYNKEIQREYPWMYRGCGAKFRWYFGTQAICPYCGYTYLVTIEDVKTGFYKRVQ